MYDEMEAAYLAGFIDGDGCIRLTLTDKNRLMIFVQVTNTDEAIIRWLMERFGGAIYYDDSANRGARAKPLHHWRLLGQPASDLISRIEPYLRIKRPQAELALRAWRDRQPQPRGYRQRYGVPPAVTAARRSNVEAMRRLNAKGI